MNAENIVPFSFGDNLVRVINDANGDPWFVAKDVCKILEIQNPSDTVKKCLDDDEKGIANIYTPGGEQEVLIISESGLYALVFRSRKPEAKVFSKWVRSEVLPALRKTGRYIMPGADKGIEAAKRLRPALRERVLNDALQFARLTGVSDPEEINKIYEYYCGVVGGSDFVGPNYVSKTEQLVLQYIQTCLQTVPDVYLSATSIYERFRAWWHEHSNLDMPSQKYFGLQMRRHFRALKKNGYYVYCDCAFV